MLKKKILKNRMNSLDRHFQIYPLVKWILKIEICIWKQVFFYRWTLKVSCMLWWKAWSKERHSVLYFNFEDGHKKRLIGAYVSSSLAWISGWLSGGTREKIQDFLGVLVGSLVAMLSWGSSRERAILPDVDKGGGPVWKCESGENGDLVVLKRSTQPGQGITDSSLFQSCAGAGYGRGIGPWASIWLRDSHQGLGPNHGWVEGVSGIDGPCNPPVGRGDSSVFECYLQPPTRLVVCPVQVSRQLWKITTCGKHPVWECLVSARLSWGCH